MGEITLVPIFHQYCRRILCGTITLWKVEQFGHWLWLINFLLIFWIINYTSIYTRHVIIKYVKVLFQNTWKIYALTLESQTPSYKMRRKEYVKQISRWTNQVALYTSTRLGRHQIFHIRELKNIKYNKRLTTAVSTHLFHNYKSRSL